MAAARDSLGFPLACLTVAEVEARERSLRSGAGASQAKAWQSEAATIASFASDPAAAAPRKLKQLARGGIPPTLRPALWFQLSGGAALAGAFSEGYYDALVKEADAAASPKSVISRAELELFNPFPSHPLLSSIKGMRAARRVVLAHAKHCGAAEYAQGVSSVAALLLAVMGMGKEEEVFWTLAGLTRYRLPPQYFEELRGCRVEQRALEELARRKVGRVASLFDKLETPLGDVTGDWCVYLFTRSLPPETSARIFDCLLTEGPKALHRAGLGLLKLHEGALVSTGKGSLKLAQLLKWRVARTYDADALIKVAYRGLGTLQGATIAAVRAPHEAALAADHSALASRLSHFMRGTGAGASRSPSPSGSATTNSSGMGLAALEGVTACGSGTSIGDGLGVGSQDQGAMRSSAIPAPARAGAAAASAGARAFSSPPEMFKVASLRLLLAGSPR